MEEHNESSFEELLKQLLEEHMNLDEKIKSLHQSNNICLIEIQSLKKRKLYLKDQISVIESKLYPDIIA